MNREQPVDVRLTVLNPLGRDQEQTFPDGAGEPGSLHAPVNFHAFTACTRGTFHRLTARAIREKTPVLLLLRQDFKDAQRALQELKAARCTVLISLKETGLQQIGQQLRHPSRLARLRDIISAAHGCIAVTPEAAHIYRAVAPAGPARPVEFIPTPYPVGDERWDFSRPFSQRSGIFVGTREWDVPSRNHLAAMLLARDLSAETGEPVTVYNEDGRSGQRILDALDFPEGQLRVLHRKLRYPDFLREVARHKIVLQLDSSFVPGQVAGDALLCRMPCVGGNGVTERLAFESTNGFALEVEELRASALRLLTDPTFFKQTVTESQRRAESRLGYDAIATRLHSFFTSLTR